MCSEYERGIRDAIRWRMTHHEKFTAEPGEPRTENGHYRSCMVPDRAMLKGSADYTERMIWIVQEFAVSAMARQPQSQTGQE